MSISPVSHSYSNFLFDGARSEAAAALDVAQNLPLPSQGIEDYLAPFKTVGLFNIQAAEEASIFLLGELHEDQSCHRMQANLIEFLASQGPVIVLIEGRESGIPLSFVRTLASGRLAGSRYWIKEFMGDGCVTNTCHNQQNISVMGWDSPIGVLHSAGYSPHDIDRLNTLVSKTDEKANLLFDQISRELPECKKVLVDVMEALPREEMLYKMAEKPNAIYREIFAKLAALFHSKKIASVDSIPFSLIKRLVLEWSAASLYEIDALEGKKHPVTLASLSKTFPLRTASMVSSLQQLAGIELCMEVENAKVVLIAGVAHLRASTFYDGDPNRDLSSLCDELEVGQHKAAILIPPHVIDKVDKLARQHLASRAGQDEEKE